MWGTMPLIQLIEVNRERVAASESRLLGLARLPNHTSNLFTSRCVWPSMIVSLAIDLMSMGVKIAIKPFAFLTEL